MRYDTAKRGMDIVLSAAGLLVLWPVLLGLWIVVRCVLGPPAFFRQQRTGKDGATFTIVKFRTMDDVPNGSAMFPVDERRISAFGRVLRRTGFDEVPQLWNILRGDMSLIGPRPLLPQYLPLYSRDQARRHAIRPGLTGWAQVNGRTEVSWERQFELDLWYIEHRSFRLDARILRRSLLLILVRIGGGSQTTLSTRREFRGNSVDAGGPMQSSSALDHEDPHP